MSKPHLAPIIHSLIPLRQHSAITPRSRGSEPLPRLVWSQGTILHICTHWRANLYSSRCLTCTHKKQRARFFQCSGSECVELLGWGVRFNDQRCVRFWIKLTSVLSSSIFIPSYSWTTWPEGCFDDLHTFALEHQSSVLASQICTAGSSRGI